MFETAAESAFAGHCEISLWRRGAPASSSCCRAAANTSACAAAAARRTVLWAVPPPFPPSLLRAVPCRPAARAPLPLPAAALLSAAWPLADVGPDGSGCSGQRADTRRALIRQHCASSERWCRGCTPADPAAATASTSRLTHWSGCPCRTHMGVHAGD